MRASRLQSKEIPEFLAAFRRKGYGIWAPVEEGGAVELRSLDGGVIPTWRFSNVRLSPKALIFPPSERMFLFSVDRKREDAFLLKEISEEAEARVAVGIRPCDARAMTVLDRVFLEQGTAQDPYFLRKRDRTLFVGLGCTAPCTTCFCSWTGGGPFSKDGLDLMLTELDDGYLLETITERGEDLLEGMDLPGAGPEEIRSAAAVAREALAAIGESPPLARIRERPMMDLFTDPYWETAHETCINCGVCAYLCPTCSCFDIQDEVRGACGFRGRNWDTCMFPLTTLHASGHNPRPTGKERFRQRFMHKLKYFFDDFDQLMCVGCGRCVQYCPVNIDIREIIATLSGSS